MAYATIRDVARRAGISVSTVSRALNGTGRISESTRLAVQRAVEELGYIPDSRARAMRSARTHTAGLLVPDIRNAYFANLAYAIQDTLFTAGYCTLIGTSSEDPARQDAFLTSLMAQRIDGAIIVPRGGRSESLESLRRLGMPMVFVDRAADGFEDVPLVDSDPMPGMRAALEDIRAHGHARVGYVSGPVGDSPSLQERERAFRVIAGELFGEEHVYVESTGFGEASCGPVLRRMAGAGVRALVFGYSPDAIEAVSLLVASGAAIGRDLSLVSFDDIEAFRMTTPQISVISQRGRTIGERGARLFLGMLDGADVTSERVETVYIPRGSVGAAS